MVIPLQIFHIVFSGRTSTSSLIFITLTDISFHPCASLGLSDLIILSIFSSGMKKSIIELVVAGKSGGSSLPVSTVMHYCTAGMAPGEG